LSLFLLPLVIMLAAPRPVLAQGDSRALSEAAELERAGRLAEAAARYRAVLRADAANVPALLGLERVYAPLSRLDSLVPLVRLALARDSLNRALHSMELRLWSALGQRDSLAAGARRWVAMEPSAPEPYREWAYAASQKGDLAQAKRALQEGSDRLGDQALAQDLAQLTALAGEWSDAARQWALVVRANPGMVTGAAGSLARTPAVARDEVLGVLLGARSDSASRRIAADVLAAWGRADEAWPLLDATLPADPRVAAAALQRFADRATATHSRQGSLVRGYALERLATLVDGVAATRVRLQASQAYADAGELAAARRMLEQAGTTGDAGGAVGPAMASLIRALAEQGSVEEAERQLKTWEPRLSGDDREALREAIAWGWMGRGELGRAEATLVPDSGVAATAVRGWIALYRGELADAREMFRAAGPYAGSREEATRRMSLLVLIERVTVDRLPEFGTALQRLARGDTTEALADLDRAAGRLPPDGGRAELLAFAGEQALAHRDHGGAERFLMASLATDSVGPAAPAAELALARVQEQTGRTEVAMHQLEHLILTHPQSAVVPQARRLMDRLRGVVPE
jgi:tetratricopeptide (TPR) repeat protein